MPITTVVFDMDGIILDSEDAWEETAVELLNRHGLVWQGLDTDFVMGGDNSSVWGEYIRRRYSLPLTGPEVVDAVITGLLERLEAHLPLMPGIATVIENLARRFTLGLASSSPPAVIDFALKRAGLERFFSAWTSSDYVERGKPFPNVYLEILRVLDRSPEESVAIEDSANGVRAAKAAGLAVIAVPQPRYPLPAEVMDLADELLGSVSEITPEMIASLQVQKTTGRRRFSH